MKKIMMMIAMMVFAYTNSVAQKDYCLTSPTPIYIKFECNESTHEIDQKYIDESKKVIQEYNTKSAEKIHYDSLVFNYPFKIKIYDQGNVVGFLWLVSTATEGTVTYHKWENAAEGSGAIMEHSINYKKRKKSTKFEDIMMIDILLEPLNNKTNEHRLLYYGHSFVDNYWFNASATYCKSTMDELLGTYNREVKENIKRNQ